VSRFQEQTGRVDVPEPLDEVWIQWRRDQVTALVRRIYLTVTAIDPRLRVSAALSSIGSAPTAGLGWETRSPYRQQLQDWRGWLEEGIIDLALPMTYRSDDVSPGDFDNWIAWEKDHQYGRGAVVGTGLFINTVQDSMDQWLRVRHPSPLGHQALGMCGYSYASHNDEGLPRRDFVNAAVTEVFSQSAAVPAIPWKDDPALGHLMGALVQPNACWNLDAYPVALTGPLSRTLLADGSGWFGAVDLVPGVYWLSAEVVRPGIIISQPVSIIAGLVTEQDIALPPWPCRSIYLPMVLKHSGP
jgi:hypothetical protein